MRSVIRQAKTVEEAVNQALEILSTDRDSVEVEIIEEPQSGFLGLFGAKDAVVKVTLKEDDVVSEIINDVFYSDSKEEESEPLIEEEIEERPSYSGEENPIIDEESFEEEEEVDLIEASDIEDQEADEAIEEDDFEGEINEEWYHDDEDISVVEDADGEKVVIVESPHKLVSHELLEKILAGMDIEGDVVTTIDGNNVTMEIINTNQRDTSIIIGKRGDTLDAIQYIINLAENKNSDEYMRISLDISDYREKRKNSLNKLAVNMAKKAKSQKRKVKLEPMNSYERKIIHTAIQDDNEVETYSEGKDPRRRVVIKLKDKE